MSKTYSDLLQEVKRDVQIVSLDEIKRRLEADEPMVLVDCREKDEVRGGVIPGALHIPRGFLEM
ncbi:MAG: molybdopterin biosynthesis protein MoeB, partial [Myxococcales bacterium]|nr:molybdopterin biosynthesis protein MoeB [Myxococcales bacterium]